MNVTVYKSGKAFKIMLYLLPFIPIVLVLISYLIKSQSGKLDSDLSFWENLIFITTNNLGVMLVSLGFWFYYFFYAISEVQLTKQSVLIKSLYGRKKEISLSNLFQVTLGETYISLRIKDGSNVSFQSNAFNKKTQNQLVEAINEQIKQHNK